MFTYIRTLKSKILFYSFGITVVVLLLVIAICLTNFNTLVKLNKIQTINHNLRISMDHIESRVSSVMNIAYWSSVNSYISAFITASDMYPNDLRYKKIAAYNALRNHVYGLGVDRYINKIIIYSTNGNYIQFGLVYGAPSDIQTCTSLPYFDLLRQHREIKWVGVVEEGFTGYNKKAIPIVQNLYTSYKQAPMGWVYISVSTDIIKDFLMHYKFDRGSNLYLLIGDKMYDITDLENFVEVDKGEFNFIDQKTKIYRNAQYVEFKKDGVSNIAVICPGRKIGWSLLQTIPNNHFAFRDEVYARILYVVICGIMMLAILMAVTIDRIVNRPIKNILTHIKRISKGDFSYDPSIESQDEIGVIGIGINKMAVEIQRLIDERIENEKAKKDLELRMLQNQINPHFLYNTLNSIKWMAMIQGAVGIVEMVNSLAVLLRNVAAGTDELITVEQEIEIVKEYCKIQQYRYGKLFDISYHFEDPSLKECKIIKFTLQPIVENSIFHGIEPKGTKGNIEIRVTKSSGDTLMISVKDDGVGMSREQIKKLMEGRYIEKKRFNNIGIKNVDERIKLIFGQPYGLKINSVLGEYTEVIITLPLIR